MTRRAIKIPNDSVAGLSFAFPKHTWGFSRSEHLVYDLIVTCQEILRLMTWGEFWTIFISSDLIATGLIQGIHY
jgi:hypothetical protein